MTRSALPAVVGGTLLLSLGLSWCRTCGVAGEHDLDAAATGSALLQDIARVHSAESWLEAFKFVGLAFLFLGIINGLSTIVWALQYQKQAIPDYSQDSYNVPAVAEPAKTLLLKYCCSRNHATKFWYSPGSWPVGSEAASGRRSRQQLC